MFAVILVKKTHLIGSLFMLPIAFSLFFFGWFSQDSASKVKEDTKEVIEIMNMEKAFDILLESGFTPQIPQINLPNHKLKVQSAPKTVYEKVENVGKKRSAIIHFWATWCGPCKHELPEFDVFAKKVEKKIDIYTITSELKDDSNSLADAIWDFYKNKSIKSLNVVVDEKNELAANLGVSGIPVTFLVNNKGKIIGSFLGATDWLRPQLLSAILTVLN